MMTFVLSHPQSIHLFLGGEKVFFVFEADNTFEKILFSLSG